MVHQRVSVCVLASIAVMSGNAGISNATLLRAMSVDELSGTADRIVVGRARSVNTAWDPSHRTIISTIEIDIEESWKGSADVQRLTIVQPGGSVGEIEMTVHGMPNFAVREKSVLFLQGRHHFQVVGMGQGKRALAWDGAGQQWLAQPPDSDGVVEVGSGAKLRHARRGGPIPLSELRAQVFRAIGRSP